MVSHARVRRTLIRARKAALARMRGTCTIRRPAGVAQDPSGPPGKMIPTYEPTPIYSGTCYLRYPGLAFEQNPVFAGATTVISRIVLRIPFGAICKPGDVVTINSDPDNPQLVGTVLRVASIDDQSQATAQRLLCEDFQQGGA